MARGRRAGRVAGRGERALGEPRATYDSGKEGRVIPDALRLSIVSGRLALAVSHSGLTRAEIARRSGVSETAISRYVRGERLVSTHALVALCDVLRVSSDWVLGLDVRTQALYRAILERDAAKRNGG